MTFSRIFRKISRAFDICTNGNNECYTVHLVEQVSELPPAFMDMLANQPNVFLQQPYLKALEESKPVDIHFAYACISKGQMPVAFMYFQLLKFRLDQIQDFLNPRYFGKALAGISKEKDNFFLKKIFNSPMHILFCGNVFLSGEHGIYIDGNFNTEELSAALPALLQEVVDRAGERSKIAGVVIKDFYERKRKEIPALEKEGFKKYYFEPNLVMKIRPAWKTFDDYIDDLSSKYRVRAKNVIKKSEKISIRELTEKDIIASRSIINTLYNQVHQKAAVHFSAVSAAYFSGLKNQLKDKFIFKGFYIDDKMIAFSTFVIGEHEAEAHLVGLDYDFNKMYALYPLILYSYIQDAIERQVPVICFGRTALEIKSSVGAKAQPMYCYVGLQSPLSMRMISPFILISEEKETIERDPFKEINLADVTGKSND